MRKNPSGPALTEIADATEAAADPGAGNANYVAAMIRNARAIAERQAAAGRTPEDAEAAALQTLLGTRGSLADLNRALARAIRDGNAPKGTHAHLSVVVRAELAESNPRYLARLDSDA
jgi:GTP cyclohydrolase III